MEEKLNIDRNVKIGIISSVIATFIFIYLLDPILRLMTYMMFDLFGSLTRWYTDGLFQRAALLTGPDPSMHLLALFTGVICGILSGIALFLILYPLLTRDENRIKVPKITSKHLRLIVTVLCIVTTVSVLLSFHRTLFPVRITSSFNQHLAAISPYATDQDIKEFRSRWTQMMCEGDYKILYNNLNRIASKNKVRLPENVVYSWSGL